MLIFSRKGAHKCIISHITNVRWQEDLKKINVDFNALSLVCVAKRGFKIDF